MSEKFIILTYRFIEEDGRVASICDELGLASDGEDFESAEAHVNEAVNTVLHHMTERGEIWDYLKERGVTVYTEIPLTKTFPNFTVRPKEWFYTSVRPLELAGSRG